jgi:peptidoglycan/xylan/chitin deacetylase (PgdA/CDA1 family)
MYSPEAELKTYCAITVDVDPDVNLPVKGQSSAVSHPIEKGEIRFASCAAGLETIVKMLNYEKINGTFFIEGRTAEKLTSDYGFDLRRMLHGHEICSHAYMHEDFLGKATSLPLNREQIREALEAGMKILNDIFHRPIHGFRAPYIRINDLMASVLVDMGFEYDSSVTKSWTLKENSFQPYYYFENSDMQIENPRALIEVPLPNWVVENEKKVTSYLWPFLEGEIPFEVYYETLKKISNIAPSNSLAVLATHSWQHIETFSQGKLGEDKQAEITKEFQLQIHDLKLKSNIEFLTISEYLDIWHSICQKEELSIIMDKL